MKMNFKFLSAVLILIIGILSINLVSADMGSGCGMTGGMMYGMYGGFGSGMMFLSWITYILFIALLISAIYWLVKSANKRK